MPFSLDNRLAADSHYITDLPLSQLRLMDNKLFPWLLLVPQVENASEWIDLSREQQHQLSDEITICSHFMQALVTPDKLNIATLGNMVSQLHIHLIGRYKGDPAWPDPVWGKGSAAYSEEERSKFIYDIKTALSSVF
jgi:diadenosine tetraphosphate (Ap4A) HIT family hydrolase